MAKDVTNSTLTEIKVDFTPAVINVDRESVEKQMAAIVAQYQGYEVTASTYKADFDERTRLNKLKEALETRRKEINSVITEPYKDFKKWYDEVVQPLDEVIGNITAGLNAINEHERQLRLDVVRANFEEKCMVAGLMKETFQDVYEMYTMKKYFKSGEYKLKKSTLDEMDALVLGEFEKLEEYKANQKVIEEQAGEYGLPAQTYLGCLGDKSLAEILSIMKADSAAFEMQKEEARIKEQAEAERLAEVERLAKENTEAHIKAYDADTGEILESDEVAPVEKAENAQPTELLTVDLRLFLYGGAKQLDELKEWLEDNFIGFETLEDM